MMSWGKPFSFLVSGVESANLPMEIAFIAFVRV